MLDLQDHGPKWRKQSFGEIGDPFHYLTKLSNHIKLFHASYNQSTMLSTQNTLVYNAQTRTLVSL